MTAVSPLPRVRRQERDEEWLTVDEVAGRWRVSRMTVYRLVHSGALRALRVGRSFRVPLSAVRDYEIDADTWSEQ